MLPSGYLWLAHTLVHSPSLQPRLVCCRINIEFLLPIVKFCLIFWASWWIIHLIFPLDYATYNLFLYLKTSRLIFSLAYSHWVLFSLNNLTSTYVFWGAFYMGKTQKQFDSVTLSSFREVLFFSCKQAGGQITLLIFNFRYLPFCFI